MTTVLTHSMTSIPRTSRRQQLLYTREDLRQLLNEDLRRERKARLAFESLVRRERAAGREGAASLIERRSKMAATHISNIVKILQDIDGRDDADVDELNAILGADRFLEPGWNADTIRRLHERARQLRTAGFSGLAKRMMRIVAEKKTSMKP